MPQRTEKIRSKTALVPIHTIQIILHSTAPRRNPARYPGHHASHILGLRQRHTRIPISPVNLSPAPPPPGRVLNACLQHHTPMRCRKLRRPRRERSTLPN
jgi:hypothetical protein